MKKSKRVTNVKVSTADAEATGRMIKSYMERYGLDVADLQVACGVSGNAVYKWLEGKSIPSPNNLVALSDVFEVPIDKLLVKDRSTTMIAQIKQRRGIDYGVVELVDNDLDSRSA